MQCVLHTDNSQRGVTIIELMMAMAILGVLMAAAYSSLAVQTRAYAAQTMAAGRLNETRMALQVMAEQIAMAGFGGPSATTPAAVPKLITTAPSRLSFWTKVNIAHTFLAAAATKDGTVITVVSAASLPPDTSFYLTDTKRWYLGTVQQVTGNTVSIAPPLTYDFAAGSFATPVEQITFEWVGSELQRNGKRLIGDVTGLNFTYDSAVRSAIRHIRIELTTQSPGVDPLTVQPLALKLSASVSPPNLGL